MQNFVAIGSGVSAPQLRIRDFAVHFDVTIVFVFFLGGRGSSIRLQPTLLNVFLRKSDCCHLLSKAYHGKSLV